MRHAPWMPMSATLMMMATMFAAPMRAAQNAPPDDAPPPVTRVELREQPELAKKGKVAVYRGEADRQGVAFFLDGLGINTPVGVMLVSGDRTAPVKLAVKNDLSGAWDRYVEPDATGISQTRFRTEGPAMLLVSSTGDARPYQLLVWVGDEIRFHRAMKVPFVSAADAGASGVSWTVAGAVLGAAVIGVAVLVLARRRRTTGGAQ